MTVIELGSTSSSPSSSNNNNNPVNSNYSNDSTTPPTGGGGGVTLQRRRALLPRNPTPWAAPHAAGNTTGPRVPPQVQRLLQQVGGGSSYRTYQPFQVLQPLILPSNNPVPSFVPTSRGAELSVVSSYSDFSSSPNIVSQCYDPKPSSSEFSSSSTFVPQSSATSISDSPSISYDFNSTSTFITQSGSQNSPSSVYSSSPNSVPQYHDEQNSSSCSDFSSASYALSSPPVRSSSPSILVPTSAVDASNYASTTFSSWSSPSSHASISIPDNNSTSSSCCTPVPTFESPSSSPVPIFVPHNNSMSSSRSPVSLIPDTSSSVMNSSSTNPQVSSLFPSPSRAPHLTNFIAISSTTSVAAISTTTVGASSTQESSSAAVDSLNTSSLNPSSLNASLLNTSSLNATSSSASLSMASNYTRDVNASSTPYASPTSIQNTESQPSNIASSPQSRMAVDAYSSASHASRHPNETATSSRRNAAVNASSASPLALTQLCRNELVTHFGLRVLRQMLLAMRAPKCVAKFLTTVNAKECVVRSPAPLLDVFAEPFFHRAITWRVVCTLDGQPYLATYGHTDAMAIQECRWDDDGPSSSSRDVLECDDYNTSWLWCHHPHVMRVWGLVLDDVTGNTFYLMDTPIATLEQIQSRLTLWGARVPEYLIWCVVASVSSALLHCLEKGLQYTPLQLNNVFLLTHAIAIENALTRKKQFGGCGCHPPHKHHHSSTNTHLSAGGGGQHKTVPPEACLVHHVGQIIFALATCHLRSKWLTSADHPEFQQQQQPRNSYVNMMRVLKQEYSPVLLRLLSRTLSGGLARAWAAAGGGQDGLVADRTARWEIHNSTAVRQTNSTTSNLPTDSAQNALQVSFNVIETQEQENRAPSSFTPLVHHSVTRSRNNTQRDHFNANCYTNPPTDAQHIIRENHLRGFFNPTPQHSVPSSSLQSSQNPLNSECPGTTTIQSSHSVNHFNKFTDTQTGLTASGNQDVGNVATNQNSHGQQPLPIILHGSRDDSEATVSSVSASRIESEFLRMSASSDNEDSIKLHGRKLVSAQSLDLLKKHELNKRHSGSAWQSINNVMGNRDTHQDESSGERCQMDFECCDTTNNVNQGIANNSIANNTTSPVNYTEYSSEINQVNNSNDTQDITNRSVKSSPCHHQRSPQKQSLLEVENNVVSSPSTRPKTKQRNRKQTSEKRQKKHHKTKRASNTDKQNINATSKENVLPNITSTDNNETSRNINKNLIDSYDSKNDKSISNKIAETRSCVLSSKNTGPNQHLTTSDDSITSYGSQARRQNQHRTELDGTTNYALQSTQDNYFFKELDDSTTNYRSQPHLHQELLQLDDDSTYDSSKNTLSTHQQPLELDDAYGTQSSVLPQSLLERGPVSLSQVVSLAEEQVRSRCRGGDLTKALMQCPQKLVQLALSRQP